MENVIGQKFNSLTVIEEIERKYNQRCVRAKCECGSVDWYMLSAIKRGAIKSCGCSKKKHPTVKIGDVFGRLTVIDVSKTTIVSLVKVRCICGKERYAQINKLNIGHIRSCGCLHDEFITNLQKTHGLSQHKLNSLWRGIKKRCYNPNGAKYRYYGGIGVKMCDEWLNDFKSFYDWCMANGWKDGLEIDKDLLYKLKHGTSPGMEYSPEYCCFMTKSENCRNRRSSHFIEYNGMKKTLAEWGEIYGIKPQLLSDRLFGLNMSPEIAFNKPVKGSQILKITKHGKVS